MRVFVLCTGRSGSVSFIKACKHITNYSSGHETLSKELGARRLDYPDNHIEADNRLSWFLGSLDKKYANEPIYVRLARNKSDTVLSFTKRWDSHGGIIRAFYEGILKRPNAKVNSKIVHQVCEDYYTTVNDNMDLFLKDKKNVLRINLENIQEDFLNFWYLIKAEGNLEAAIQEFNNRYNKSDNKKKFWYMTKLLLMRIVKIFEP
jgi:hypothetical protein